MVKSLEWKLINDETYEAEHGNERLFVFKSIDPTHQRQGEWYATAKGDQKYFPSAEDAKKAVEASLPE